MKRLSYIFAVVFAALPLKARAESTNVAGSSVPVVVPVVVTTPTVIDAGETISTPTPHAMTDPAPNLSFVTLTRTLFPNHGLPANADVVFPEESRTFDAQNAGEALSHQAGILFRPQGASSYPLNATIRGATANQSLVLIDGRPMRGMGFGAGDLSEISLGQLDHIEIVRGGSSALYGPNALGGVINVITKRATYTGFPLSHVSAEVASFSRQTYKLDFGSRSGPVDYFFYGDQAWQSGFRDNSDNSQYNIGGNAGIAMGRAGKILIDAASFHNNAGVPGFNLTDPHAFNNNDELLANTPYARQITDNNSLRASYLVDLPKEMFLAARFFGQQREVDLDDSANPNPASAVSSDRREHAKGAELQLDMPYGLSVGGSFEHDHQDFSDRLALTNSFGASVENWGLFAQEKFNWDRLTLVPSVRYDKNSQFGDTTNPRVVGLFDTNEWLRFSASAGRSFRAPTIDEAALNPNLNPETAWTYDAGFELHQSSNSLRVNYFRANVGDLIEASSSSAVNVGHARRQGMEIQLSQNVNDHFHHALNYTYLDNQGIPFGVDHYVVLAYSPRHVVHYLSTVTWMKKWSIDSTMSYEDSRFSGNDQSGTKMSAQFLWDLRLAYQWRQLDVFLGIKDVTDKRYVEQPGYPLPGRTVYMGARLRLWG